MAKETNLTPQQKIMQTIKERLAKAKTRGGFEIVKDSIQVEKNLLDQPVSLKGQVKVKVDGNNPYTVPEKAKDATVVDINWAINGTCISQRNAGLDLVMTETL